ncbi:MAG: glycosyltransferase [Alphaproteobacteria bacterium]|nr:glycosyltransferase [Alphaproteobacteria bacterium]
MRTAIVHYWLFHMRGGEKVVEALCELYPDADIFTHLYDPSELSSAISSHRVATTFIARLPFARRLYRHYLPLMPLALEELDLSAYDLVISSEAGPAKGVITRPDALHVCYCHSPMRYLWDQYHIYLKTAGLPTRALMPLLFHGLRQWDVASASRVDHFIANSTAVAARIRKFYRRDAEVIPPPVDAANFSSADQRRDYYLFVGQLVGYKRADLAVEAFNRLGKRLVVIGDGEESRALKHVAGPTIEFLGKAPFDVLRRHYGEARALVFPGEEDFGIVPVEAMASGTPVIAFGRGGALDSVVDGTTGLFFREQTVEALIEAVARFEAQEERFDRAALAAHAAHFDKKVFKERFAATVDRLLGPRVD